MELTVLAVILLASLLILFRKSIFKKFIINNALNSPFPKAWEDILLNRVVFFKQLPPAEQETFKRKVQLFLRDTKISGVQTEVNDELKILVACSAIIPVFYFENWLYINLVEVVIYNDVVDSYKIENTNFKNFILGQVRPFQNKNILLLSKPLLEKGFSLHNQQENVGFHEFAHLIDGTDGTMDGIPKTLIPSDLVKPWTELMYREIERMKKGKSDINLYGLTNHAEFFAVVLEYFFENNDKFHKKHPELFQILSKTFKSKVPNM